jgi:dUTP pyrophosphatase
MRAEIQSPIKIARVKPGVYTYMPIMPDRATPGASGFDLRAMGDHVLAPFRPRIIPTGWRIEIPLGWEGQVRARSGLAKKGILVANAPGTVDSDYRGEIGAVLVNIDEEPYHIEHGDRIAQLVICPVWTGELQIVEVLSETARGGAGYGSTGLK